MPLDEPLRALLTLTVIIVSAGIAARLSRRLAQPAVVGVLVCGMVIGTVFHALPENIASACLSDHSLNTVHAIAQLGLVLLMFSVGQELRASRGGEGSVPSYQLLFCALIPLVICALAAVPVAHTITGSAGSSLSTTLFLGIALTATAVPVLAVIVRELGVAGERIPSVAMRIAVLTDGIVWLLVTALVVTVTTRARPSIGLAALGLVGVVVVAVVIPRVARYLDGRGDSSGALVPVMFASAVIGAVSTHLVGAHPAIGAAIAGFAFPSLVSQLPAHRALPFSDALLPVFFVNAAFAAPLQALSVIRGWAGIGGLVLLLLAAFVSKLLVFAVTGLARRWTRREAIALGVLLNCRGLTEIAIASVGFQSGLINSAGFAVLTIVAVVTTSATAPLYRRAMPRKTTKPQRLEPISAAPESWSIPAPSTPRSTGNERHTARA